MKLEELEEYIAPCVFHDDRHEDCIQHSGQVPCMTQTESDWLNSENAERAALEAERDEYKRAAEHYVPVAHALAAHLDKFYSLIGQSHSDDEDFGLIVRELINQSPATSLARVKAQGQAEALDDAAEAFELEGCHIAAAQALRRSATELRRQAEENHDE
jgi:hypothetical protein